jgi:hypothetical protein
MSIATVTSLTHRRSDLSLEVVVAAVAVDNFDL